ncbi:MAG: hypothetical protein WCL71_11720 [Deltaproteobacteria bacterium]
MKLQRIPIIRTLSVIYLLIFLGLALYDEPLKTDVAEFLKVPSASVPDAENAYFAQLGFTAPPGTDTLSFGIAKYRKTLEEAAKKRAGNIQEVPTKGADSSQISFKGKELPKDKLYQFATDPSSALDILAKDNAELLARYHALRRYRHIEEPGGNGLYQDVPIPAFTPILSTQSLTLLLALRSAHEGKLDEALGVLADDMTYWRGILRQTHTLIGKMIAIACIQKDYQVLSELIGHNDLSERQRIQVRGLLAPWKSDDANFGEAALYEALYVSESLFASLPEHGLLNGLFLKKNASKNTIVRFYMENSRISKITAEEFYRSLAIQQKDQKELARLHPDFLYNPVGAILNSIAIPQLSSYFSRFHDLEAKRRMVLIHLMAREQGIGHDGMPKLVKEAGREYTNPYTGQPMQWNEGKKSIVMDSIPSQGKAEQRRVELAL